MAYHCLCDTSLPGMSEPPAPRDSPPAAPCLHPGQEVKVWRPLMTTTVSTAAAAFTAPALAPRAVVAPPPPPPAVPFQGVSTSHSTYVAHAIERPHITQPPSRQVLPFQGSSTAHTDFPAHPIPRRRPSLGIATAGDRMHLVLPGILPLPAVGAVRLTTVHEGQQDMQLLVYQGEEQAASRNRLLATLAVGGLRGGRRRGEVQLQVCVGWRGHATETLSVIRSLDNAVGA